jgi:hypothetical protein
MRLILPLLQREVAVFSILQPYLRRQVTLEASLLPETVITFLRVVMTRQEVESSGVLLILCLQTIVAPSDFDPKIPTIESGSTLFPILFKILTSMGTKRDVTWHQWNCRES